ncbi:MAG: NUDIX hydrolase [Tissierellia bacterium]|nr:NUDIX hydrolase [Tissierellia bacterium]
MTYEEKTMKSEKLYEGKIINLRIDTVELPDKKYSKREIVEHPGGVAIVGITDENEILLVKQYRKAVDRVLLELPAGKIEVNEEPKETAFKELKEETGYSTENLEYLLEFYTSPGFSTEKVYIFLAENMEKGEQELESGEYIEVESYKIDDLIKMIKKGEIIDSKTIIGIYAMKDRLS